MNVKTGEVGVKYDIFEILKECDDYNNRPCMTPHRHTNIQYGGTVAQLLALLALPPTSKKVMGSIPTWGTVGSGGQVLPRVNSAQVGYLPGLSVWSLHVLPVFTPTEKTCKIKEHMSVPDQDGRFTWSPGAEKLPTAPGGSWRKDSPGWEKSRDYIHSDLRSACVCVCVLCRLHISCVLQCVVCAIKNLTKVLIIKCL